MKNLARISCELQGLISLIFMGMIMTYGFVCLYTGNESMSLSLMWEFVLLSSIYGVIHSVIYSDLILKNSSIAVKLINYFIISVIVLIVFIFAFDWVALWGISFTAMIIIYVLYFFSGAYGFYLYEKITGERFNEKLVSYKKNLKDGEI